MARLRRFGPQSLPAPAAEGAAEKRQKGGSLTGSKRKQEVANSCRIVAVGQRDPHRDRRHPGCVSSFRQKTTPQAVRLAPTLGLHDAVEGVREGCEE